MAATAVDGPNDQGIDAWHVEASDDEVTLYLAQSKNTKLDKDAADKLYSRLPQLFDETSNLIQQSNETLRENVKEFLPRLNQGGLNLNLVVYFVTSSKCTDANREYTQKKTGTALSDRFKTRKHSQWPTSEQPVWDERWMLDLADQVLEQLP